MSTGGSSSTNPGDPLNAMLTFVARKNAGVDDAIAQSNASIAQSNQQIAEQEARRVQKAKAGGASDLLTGSYAGYSRTLGGGNSLSA